MKCLYIAVVKISYDVDIVKNLAERRCRQEHVDNLMWRSPSTQVAVYHSSPSECSSSLVYAGILLFSRPVAHHLFNVVLYRCLDFIQISIPLTGFDKCQYSC